MTTTKKDTVIDTLVAYVQSHDDCDAAKLMLYANPNGSGLLGENPKGLGQLKAKIADMNRNGGVFDPEGLQLPLNSLGIEARMRHAIDELLIRIEIANLMRAHLYVAHTKGEEWPPKPILGQAPHVIKIPTIKAIKSAAKEALVVQLPTIVGMCYAAKYKSANTFSYNAAETKFYTLKNEFIKTSLDWIYRTLNLDMVRDNESMFSKVFSFQNDDARKKLIYEEWFNYRLTKDVHHYPPAYDKFAKAITARVGKILFDSPPEGQTKQSYAPIVNFAQQFVKLLGLEGSLKEKKKDLQLKVFDIIRSYVRDAYTQYQTVEERVLFIGETIRRLLQYIGDNNLGIEAAFLEADMFVSDRSFYTKRDFEEVRAAFSQTGVCNVRVMNAIYQFISTTSLLKSGDARKHIDHSIEMSLVEQADLTKIKTELNDQMPSIVFSQEALGLMTPENQTRFLSAHGSRTGYVQKAVMSITSALRVGPNYQLPNGVNDEAELKSAANMFHEMSSIYAYYASPTLESRKKAANTDKADKKMKAKHGVNGGGSPSFYVPVNQSPNMFNPQNSVFSAEQAPAVFYPAPSVLPDQMPNAFPIEEILPQVPQSMGMGGGLFGPDHNQQGRRSKQGSPELPSVQSLFTPSDQGRRSKQGSPSQGSVQSSFGNSFLSTSLKSSPQQDRQVSPVSTDFGIFGADSQQKQGGRSKQVSPEPPSVQSLFTTSDQVGGGLFASEQVGNLLAGNSPSQKLGVNLFAQTSPSSSMSRTSRTGTPSGKHGNSLFG